MKYVIILPSELHGLEIVDHTDYSGYDLFSLVDLNLDSSESYGCPFMVSTEELKDLAERYHVPNLHQVDMYQFGKGAKD